MGRHTCCRSGRRHIHRHYGDIDEQKLADDLAGAARFFADEIASTAEPGENAIGKAIAAGRLRKLFQIDDGYCKVGDWLDVNAQKFPHGLADLALRIRLAGFLPGLWIAPIRLRERLPGVPRAPGMAVAR